MFDFVERGWRKSVFGEGVPVHDDAVWLILCMQFWENNGWDAILFPESARAPVKKCSLP